MTLSISTATNEDIPALLDLEKSSFETDKLSETEFKRLITSQAATVAVIRQSQQLVGCAVLLFKKTSKTARIFSFAIDKQFHGQGIASALLQWLEEYVQSHQAQELYLEVRSNNQRAISFYKKHGFEVFGEYQEFYEDGEDALRMRKLFN